MLAEILRRAKEEPEALHAAPASTPVGRPDETAAARRPVVKITPAGEVVEAYPSARAAAKANHMSYQAVLDRCNGKVKKPFALDGYDYRFED